MAKGRKALKNGSWLGALAGILLSQGIIGLLNWIYDRWAQFWPLFDKLAQKYDISIFQVGTWDFLGMLLPAFLLATALRRKAKDWGLDKFGDPTSWLIGLMLGATLFIALDAFKASSKLFTVTGIHLIIGYTIIGFTEEVFYRGFLQSELAGSLGRVWGSILQITLYAVSPISTLLIIHHANIKVVIAQIIFMYLPIGIVATILRQVSGRVWAGAIAHSILGLAFILSSGTGN